MEPYKDAHTPWEPNSVAQVAMYMNPYGVNSDPILRESVTNLIIRGWRNPDELVNAIINVCHAADTILATIMMEVIHGK